MEVEVTSVVPGEKTIGISVDGEAWTITEHERTEIAPEVYVFCGQTKETGRRFSRLAFEAPKSVRIERLQ